MTAFCEAKSNQIGEVMRARNRRKPSRRKSQTHGQSLRQQGLRPIEIWVPDTRSAAFTAKAHRQSAAVAKSAPARADQDFVDAISQGA